MPFSASFYFQPVKGIWAVEPALFQCHSRHSSSLWGCFRHLCKVAEKISAEKIMYFRCNGGKKTEKYDCCIFNGSVFIFSSHLHCNTTVQYYSRATLVTNIQNSYSIYLIFRFGFFFASFGVWSWWQPI